MKNINKWARTLIIPAVVGNLLAYAILHGAWDILIVAVILLLTSFIMIFNP